MSSFQMLKLVRLMATMLANRAILISRKTIRFGAGEEEILEPHRRIGSEGVVKEFAAAKRRKSWREL